MKKIIFLDHDSVICLNHNWGTRSKKQKKWGKRKMPMHISLIPIEFRFDDFDKDAINILNEILKETDADIVISSDWRLFSTLEELGQYYELQGIIKKPIGFTKKLGEFDTPKDFQWIRHLESEQARHFEIKQYLTEHPDTTHWVAVDDLHMGVHVESSSYGSYDRDWGLENFVWTPNDWEGLKQNGIKEKILKFLE